jgi:hypothetical protein
MLSMTFVTCWSLVILAMREEAGRHLDSVQEPSAGIDSL